MALGICVVAVEYWSTDSRNIESISGWLFRATTHLEYVEKCRDDHKN
jgi:hypothetical protein